MIRKVTSKTTHVVLMYYGRVHVVIVVFGIKLSMTLVTNLHLFNFRLSVRYDRCNQCHLLLANNDRDSNRKLKFTEN